MPVATGVQERMRNVGIGRAGDTCRANDISQRIDRQRRTITSAGGSQIVHASPVVVEGMANEPDLSRRFSDLKTPRPNALLWVCEGNSQISGPTEQHNPSYESIPAPLMMKKTWTPNGGESPSRVRKGCR